MTTSPANIPVQPTTNSRLFVGDDRPQQVMFREGLLYVARTVRPRICIPAARSVPAPCCTTSSRLAPPPLSCRIAAALAATGANIGAPALALETEWFNGQNVPDPTGNINGFGFYQPMFESPADVISSGPVSPINLLPWFDKLFVGMTTGGTSNVANTFSRNYPSLWDFRPGDDAYDTVQPYLDPYTGVVTNVVPCPGNVTRPGNGNQGFRDRHRQRHDGFGRWNVLDLGQRRQLPGHDHRDQCRDQSDHSEQRMERSQLHDAFGNLANLHAHSARRDGDRYLDAQCHGLPLPATAPSNVITVASATGLQIGQTISATGVGTNKTATVVTGNATILLNSTTNVGVGELVTGGTTTAAVSTTAGSPLLTLPTTAQVAVGEGVSGTGIPANTYVSCNHR